MHPFIQQGRTVRRIIVTGAALVGAIVSAKIGLIPAESIPTVLMSAGTAMWVAIFGAIAFAVGRALISTASLYWLINVEGDYWAHRFGNFHGQHNISGAKRLYWKCRRLARQSRWLMRWLLLLCYVSLRTGFRLDQRVSRLAEKDGHYYNVALFLFGLIPLLEKGGIILTAMNGRFSRLPYLFAGTTTKLIVCGLLGYEVRELWLVLFPIG